MVTLKTIRGQSARIIESDNKFAIELYANGKWSKPCSCFKNEFESEAKALNYFSAERNSIHS